MCNFTYDDLLDMVDAGDLPVVTFDPPRAIKYNVEPWSPLHDESDPGTRQAWVSRAIVATACA